MATCKKDRDLILLKRGKLPSDVTSVSIAFLLVICKLMEDVLLADPDSKIRTTL